MRKSAVPAAVFAAVVATAAVSGQTNPGSTQAPAPAPTAARSNSAGGSGMQIMTGTVTEYAPGRRIVLKLDGGQELAMDLEPKVRVDGLVAVGQLAALMWMTENGGKKRVTSITAAPGPGGSGKDELTSSYAAMSAPQPTAVPANLTPAATPAAPRPRTPRTTPTPARGAPTLKPTPPLSR